MTEPSPPQRIAVIWSPEARTDLRAINRETAMQKPSTPRHQGTKKDFLLCLCDLVIWC
jgi:hypothetical protein